MMKAKFVLYIFLWFLPIKNIGQTIFKRVDPIQSGIVFNNNVPESENLNIITYEYFYNGGGVAIADFNNDGLEDIYFTANLAPNRLYQNLGNWQFKDITNTAKVAGKKGWKTGVSIADVNGDGWLDIYVCYSGDVEPEMRKNQLFINNHNLTFTEKAESMGIADAGHTTQAAFFDYDRDGDLDLFVLNHNIKNLRNFDAAFVKKMVDPDAGDRLYRNDNQHFTDVTQEAGIISNPLGYGLGIALSDLNNDGWIDIYVSNDYVEEDYLYINNQNGTFSDQLKNQLGHLSNFSMGVDIADFNNDGWMDIFTLDMLPADNKRQKLLFAPDNYEAYNNAVHNGFHHQLMRNMLHLNNGNGTYSEIGQLAGVSNTDWSWAALFADFNHDGLKDLFVSNGYGRDMINRDFMKFYANERLKFLKGEPSEKMFQMLKSIKSTPLRNYFFENQGNLQFKDCSLAWGFNETDYAHGAAYGDLDNDGDLDLVVNRMNDMAAIYQNQYLATKPTNSWLQIKLKDSDKNPFALGARVEVYTPNGTFTQENFPVRGFQSSMHIPLHFGLPSPKIDSLKIRWANGEYQTLKSQIPVNQIITIEHTSSSPQKLTSKPQKPIFSASDIPIAFSHQEDDANDFKDQPLIPNMLSYNGYRAAKADINRDGLEDIYFCGAKGQAGQLFMQNKNGEFRLSPQIAFNEDASSEDMEAVFFDADNDQDLDLYVVSGGYAFSKDDKALQDRLYLNEKGVFKKSLDALPNENASGSCVKPVDFDQDGDLDLFIGGRVIPGAYPETPESALLENDGKGKFNNVIVTKIPDLQKLGMITDALWADLNQDKKPDLIVCGEWMKIYCFENQGNKFIDATQKYFPQNLSGWWNRLTVADFDKDGDLDLIAANWGNNSQIKVTEKETAMLYYADFDANGSIDPLLCYYIEGSLYPMASRDELTDQITSFRRKFPTYDIYSEAKIEQILTPEQLQKAQVLQANFFETIYFENQNGKMIPHSLPIQANMSPIYAISIEDFNKDGHLDALLMGNIEHTRLKIGRIDANFGVLLLGNGKGNFEYVPQTQSGLAVKGCVRNILSFKNGTNTRLVINLNNQNPLVINY
jgi:hypothetical protein